MGHQFAVLGLTITVYIRVFDLRHFVLAFRLSDGVTDRISTCISVLRLDGDLRDAVHRSFHKINQLFRLCLCESYGIRLRSAIGQYEVVIRLIHIFLLSIDGERAQFGVRGERYVEVDGVVCFRCTVLSYDVNLRCAVRGAIEGGDGLITELCHREDIRHHLGRFRQGDCIVEAIRFEARQFLAINEDIRQEGIGALFARIGDGIGILRAVFGGDEYALMVCIVGEAEDTLSFSRRNGDRGQQSSFVQIQGVFVFLGQEAYFMSCYLEVRQSSI